MIILGALVVRLISHHNMSSSGSVILNEKIERSPSQKLEVQDLVSQNPDGEEITFDDSISADDQGNYIPGTYEIPVYANQKKSERSVSPFSPANPLLRLKRTKMV